MRRAPFRSSAAGLLLVVTASLAAPLAAQPWKRFFAPPPGTHGYVEVPHHPDLNPANAFTFEAWIRIYDDTPVFAPAACGSIAGKNWTQAWWIGICRVGGKQTLRSYLKGEASLRDAGTIPFQWWAHVAVTFDGSKRRHYVDGELVGEFAETGPLPASADPLRIFSDTQWGFTPYSYIREARLWRVARTLAQLRGTINKSLTAPLPGLVAVWPLAGDVADVVGPHDGTVRGTGSGGSYPPQGCDTDGHTVCLADRFEVRVRWQHPGGAGVGTVVPGFSTDSALFWFFAPANWELLVKSVDGCDLNDRRWIFYAPVTDVHYDVEVFDAAAGKIRVFFGYQGATQGAADTDAFDTCP
jgi:hypothetical protein